MTELFLPSLSTEEQARRLGRHYPKGRIWVNKNNRNTNFGKLLYALAEEFLRDEYFTSLLSDELYLTRTNGLLAKWEESVGIPDDCFTANEDLATRRLQVLMKLTDFGGAQTENDFIEIALLFGFSITITRVGSSAVFPLAFPLNFFGGAPGVSSRNTIFVSVPTTSFVFPIPFPLSFSSSSGNVLECIFRALVPATTDVIFQFGS